MTPVLLGIIAALLFLNAWQCFHHERTMVRLSGQWQLPPPLMYDDLPKHTQPISLLVPLRAGWGTLMDDIAPTKQFGKLPSYTLQEFGGAMGVPLHQAARSARGAPNCRT